MRSPNPSQNLIKFKDLLIKSISDKSHYVRIPLLVQHCIFDVYVVYPESLISTDDAPDFFGQMHDVIRLIPNLASLTMHGFDDPTQLLKLFLATSASPSLTFLEMYVYGDDPHAFDILGQLQQLTSLTLHMTNDPEFAFAESGRWIHTVKSRVIMPCVSNITWRTRFVNPLPRDAFALMAACCFAPGCRLVLEVSFDGMKWEMEDAVHIMAILKSYKPSHVTLEFMDKAMLAIIAPQIVQIPSVEIRNGIYASEIFRQDVFPSALGLFIDYCSANLEAFTDFMAIFTHLDTMKHNLKTRVDIHLEVYFETWTPLPNVEVERLFWRYVRDGVHRLKQRNIWVDVYYFSVNLRREVAAWQNFSEIDTL